MVVENGVLTKVTKEDLELLKTNSDEFWRGVTEIGESAFEGLNELSSIVIPEGIKAIGSFAFKECSGLTQVKMPSTLEKINPHAFSSCTKLEEIDLPSVKEIADAAFCNCSSLKRIVLPEGLEKVDSWSFYGCVGLKEIVIPGSLKVIPDGLFYRNKSQFGANALETVKISQGVTKIGLRAFEENNKLTNVEIPEGVKYISGSAFNHCYELKNIVLPESLSSIGNEAFANCTSLENIVIPSNVTGIGEKAFYNCIDLKEAVIKGGIKKIPQNAFGSCVNLSKIEISEGVEEICEQAFYLCRSLTSVDIPGSVKTIGGHAFENCSGITTLNIQNGVKTIEANAFTGCSSIKQLNIPDSVEFIGPYAFYDCKSLESISIPMSVETISPKAFHHCDFKYIYINNDKIFLSKEKDETKEGYECYEYNERNATCMLSLNFRQNYIQLHKWKEENKIRFIPPNYVLQTIPVDQIGNFFLNNNNQRWGRLVKEIGFEGMDFALPELLKLYYALGGFSENQGESERAYKYIVDYVAKPESDNVTTYRVAEEIHQRFSKLELNGSYNKDFAQFFMRYYKDNKYFMSFDLPGREYNDYICDAHNKFNYIQKIYPNRVVAGNTERELLSPRFVAEHCPVIEYENVEEGNENLAELVGKYGYTQEQFEQMQQLYDVAKKEKDKYVIIADKAKETDAVKFRLLEKDDPLGFVLGDITNCCQHIGGAGGSCVDDGYTNPEAGFLVFEESVKDENGNDTGETIILAQAYIWYDPKTKTVCYDNIEIPTAILDRLRRGKDGNLTTAELLEAVERSAEAIMRAMNKNGVMVESVTTGEGFNDLRTELRERGYERKTRGLASHEGYGGYTDADEAQYVIKTYDGVTTECAEETKKDAEKARTSLKDIFRAIKNRLTGKDL